MKQLIDQVKTAISEAKTLRIEGGNSKAHIGRATECSETLSLKDHTGIAPYNPVELVMTAKAGTTIAEINAELAKHGQFLPAECPDFDGRATIGGTLAANCNGAGRPFRGALRDLVLGCYLINGKGEHLRFGGTVLKNVAGYDVSRLQSGAMGTLGVIEEVSFKVLPRPAMEITLSKSCSAEDAITTMNKLAAGSTPLSASAWVSGTLYLRLAGAKTAVKAAMAQLALTEADDSIWTSLNQLWQDCATEGRYRLSVKSTAAPSGHAQIINWGGAERWISSDATLAQMQQAAVKMGGEARWIGTPREAEVNPAMPDALKALQQRLKQSIDPRGVFNPGRLYSWN